MTLSDILQRLEGVKRSGDGYIAKCPHHADSTPSLSVSEKEGKVLLHCFAGCSYDDIIGAMGLAKDDLQAPEPTQRTVVEAEYYYGASLKKVKYRKADGSKYCTWQHLEGDKWKKGRQGIAPGLYQSHEELPQIFFLVEGEKDVDNLKAAGMPAVSLPDGAQSKWASDYDKVFRGKKVVILPDNDEPGKKYAQMCAGNLYGKAAGVWVLDLSQVWPDLPDKGDISDMIFRFGTEAAIKTVMDLLEVTQQWQPTVKTQEQNPLLIRACDVPYEPPRWLISPYFQKGKGTLIQADNGTGKTAFMCAIAAMVSAGNPLINIPVNTPGDVLILSVEDDLPVLRGRIEANGGNLSKCHFMSNAAGMTFNSPEIEQAVKQVQARLIIFDPFQAFLGAGIDMFRPNQTRPELSKLFEMCDRNDCACAIISHMGKNGFNKSAVNQSLGSVDIPAAMRSILQIIKNPESESERIAIHIKCSNAPVGRSIVYSIGDRGGVEWRGFCDFTIEDMNAVAKRKERGFPYDQEPLVQVFNQLITDRPEGGFWTYDDFKSEGAKILGFPPFGSIGELKKLLDSSLAKELQKHDRIIVTHSAKGRGNTRGIRIERYKVPDGYQLKIQDG